MDALKRALAVLAIGAAEPASAQDITPWRPTIEEASARFGIPAAWIERVMVAESGGHTLLAGKPITSRAGAMGLMQLMPLTWAAMREALGLGRNPHDPHDNIMAGTYYLRLMYERFGYPGLFGAYNAGPGRYQAYLAGTQRLPAETVGYLAQTAGQGPRGSAVLPEPQRQARMRNPNSIFFASRENRSFAAPAPTGSALFLIKAPEPGQ